MQDIIQYIIEDAYILIPVLYVIGLFLKHTPRIPDWIIPWVLLVVATAIAVWMLDDVLKGVIQGVLVTGVTVLAHQLVKQTFERS